MMSNTMLSLLVAVCAFQVIAADRLGQAGIEVQRSKNNVQSVINQLERAKWNAEFTTTNKINNKKLEFMGNVNGFVNPAINSIRADVDAAKAQGKNAEQCHENARSNLRTASLKAFADLDSCDRDAKSTLQSALSPLDSLASTGKGLLNELDRIPLNCMSSNILQMRNCVTMQLVTVNISVRSFESNADSAKSSVQNNANNAVLNIQSCGSDVTNVVRAKATDARLAAANCIKNA